MIFLFPRWDMLIPWRVYIFSYPRVGAMSQAGDKHTSSLFGSDLGRDSGLRYLVDIGQWVCHWTNLSFCFGFGGGGLVLEIDVPQGYDEVTCFLLSPHGWIKKDLVPLEGAE